MGHANLTHFFKFNINRELSEIYISVMIRSLALSLISVFIPIYLYSNLGGVDNGCIDRDKKRFNR